MLVLKCCGVLGVLYTWSVSSACYSLIVVVLWVYFIPGVCLARAIGCILRLECIWRVLFLKCCGVLGVCYAWSVSSTCDSLNGVVFWVYFAPGVCLAHVIP